MVFWLVLLLAQGGEPQVAEPVRQEAIPEQPAKAEPGPVAIPEEKKETPKLQAGYDGGFFIGNPDFRLTVEGLLQVNGTYFDPDKPYVSEFTLRRMRLEFSGDFFDFWNFHVEPNFSEDSVELEEAWVGFHVSQHQFIFGRMKEPFSLEECSYQRHMDMLNLSILNQLVPSEDHGVTVIGQFGILEYGLGFYNGTGGEDTNNDKDVAGRLVLHPWRGLQFGGAATYGRQDTDVSGDSLNTEARVPFTEFVDGTKIDGEKIRVGAEAAFLEGPFAFIAELMQISDEMKGGVHRNTVKYLGGYVQASYVLTGETKHWKGVHPDRPFLRKPDIGAWQLVARWSCLHLDDDLRPYVTNDPERIDSVTVGVNWYANDFVKIKLDLLRTMYAEKIEIKGKSHDHVDCIMVQFQLMF